MFQHKYAFVTMLVLVSACNGGGSNRTDNTSSTMLDHSGLLPMTAEEILKDEHLSGGSASTFISNKDAFSQSPNTIKSDFQLDANFSVGDHIFRNPHQDVGPLLNANNCQGCHLNDGRGKLPANIHEPMTSMLLKIGLEDGSPDPVYGNQIQTFAEQSFTTSNFQSGWPVYQGSLNGDQLYGEAFAYIQFDVIKGIYPDDTLYQLHQPTYYIKDLSFGDFHADIRFSPRVTPHVFGSGLLGSIPTANILALADENDANNDGISGKASFVADAISGKKKLGRFGYKAQSATVLDQIIRAYLNDIGLTTPFLPNENCTTTQVACQVIADKEQNSGDQVDFSNRQLALVEFYNRTLAVPNRRGFDPTSDQWQQNVIKGRKLFFDIGCKSCHVPRHITQKAQGSVLGEITLTGLKKEAKSIQVLSNQTIYPYTDLLLHDMGGNCQVTRELSNGNSCSTGNECLYVQRCDGLADGLIQGNAAINEWKTPPLWGLGLVKIVNPEARFLHDGRAKTIEDAILWHGGEAENTKQQFMNLSKLERAELLAFLESL